MKNKIVVFLLITILFIPKVNIIKIPGISTGIRLEDILICVLTVISLINLYKTKFTIKSKELKKIILIFSIYFACCFISVIIGSINNYISPFQGIIFTIRKLEYFICIYFGYIFFKQNFNTKNEFKVYKVVDIVTIFNVLICSLQYFGLVGSFNGGEYLDYLTQNRISSIFNGSYELCGFLLFNFVYYFYHILFVQKKFSKRKILDIIYCILIILIILVSESRMSLLSLGIVSIIMIITRYGNTLIYCLKNAKIYWKQLLTILLIVISLVAIIFGTGIMDSSRFSTVSVEGFYDTIECAWKYKDFDLYLSEGSWYGNPICLSAGTDGSFIMRFNHWAQLLDGFGRSPIFGLGPSITTVAADGNYIRVLVESGIVGFITWSIMIIYMIKLCLVKDKWSSIVRYSLYSILIGCIFIDVFEASKIMMIFWFILGALIANKEVKNEKKCNNNQ